MKRVICAICPKDITNGTKVMALHSYKIVDGYICSNCAKVDLFIAHEKSRTQTKEFRNEIRKEFAKELKTRLDKALDLDKILDDMFETPHDSFK